MENVCKVKGLYVNGNDCVMPSVFTQSKIFKVIAKREQAQRLEEVTCTACRTSEEAYTYQGYKLDLKYDYPILHYLISQKQKQRKEEINIDFNKLLKIMGMQVRPENRKKLFERIEQFRKCTIRVIKYKGKGNLHDLPSVSTGLVREIRHIDKAIYQVSIPPEIDSIVNHFDTQKIDLNLYASLKDRSTKGIYLTLKSYAFINRPALKLKLEAFKVHYDDSRSDDQVKEDLKVGFKELVDKKLIKSFEPIKKARKTQYLIQMI